MALQHSYQGEAMKKYCQSNLFHLFPVIFIPHKIISTENLTFLPQNKTQKCKLLLIRKKELNMKLILNPYFTFICLMTIRTLGKNISLPRFKKHSSSVRGGEK